jgi:flagellar basal body rod protein FlgB
MAVNQKMNCANISPPTYRRRDVPVYENYTMEKHICAIGAAETAERLAIERRERYMRAWKK